MTPRARKILALYDRGLSLREIGERCGGVSKQAINHVLRRLGAPRREPPAVTQAELAHQRRLAREAEARERDAIVAALIRAGELTYAEIAQRLGVGLRTIESAAKRRGLGPGKGGRAELAWAKRERHEARNRSIVRLVLARRLTCTEIGKRFGLSAGMVRKIAVAAGAPRRRAG